MAELSDGIAKLLWEILVPGDNFLTQCSTSGEPPWVHCVFSRMRGVRMVWETPGTSLELRYPPVRRVLNNSDSHQAAVGLGAYDSETSRVLRLAGDVPWLLALRREWHPTRANPNSLETGGVAEGLR